jgi:hypothetical protein
MDLGDEQIRHAFLQIFFPIKSFYQIDTEELLSSEKRLYIIVPQNGVKTAYCRKT